MSDREIEIDGDRVVRPAYPWTATIHALLSHLRDGGFDKVPVPLGLDDGLETLSMIRGESGADGWARVVSEEGLRAFARFLRTYHAATESFSPGENTEWAFDRGGAGPGQVICHGDPGPWNVVWNGYEPVGLIDFDFAGPGDPLLDVAYALEYVAPFCDDQEALQWRGYTAAPDRRQRIAIFAESYGVADSTGLVDAVIARQRLDIERVRELASRGLEPQMSWVQDGYLGELAERVRWSEEHRTLCD